MYEVRYEIDASDVIQELDKLSKGVDYKLARELDYNLRQQFDASQEEVHIWTNSLKPSGKVTSTTRKNKMTSAIPGEADWEGIISYGGSTTGPVNPVEHAYTEYNRGNEHALFFDIIPTFEPFYTRAILEWYGRKD